MPTIPAALDNQDSLEFKISSALEAADLSPKDEKVKALAVSELKTAIENFYRHLDPAVSLQRSELRELEKSFAKAASLIENISPQTLSIYSKASRQINQLHSLSENLNIKAAAACDDELKKLGVDFIGEQGVTSIGEIGIPLRKALEVVQKAITLAGELENKVADTQRNILAYEVARVLEETLKIPAAATRDITAYAVGNRSGGAYARLLRKMLNIVDDDPPIDLYPLIARGLKILKNPRGDNLE